MSAIPKPIIQTLNKVEDVTPDFTQYLIRSNEFKIRAVESCLNASQVGSANFDLAKAKTCINSLSKSLKDHF